MEELKCSYGCGADGKFRLKNGKYCCKSKPYRCVKFNEWKVVNSKKRICVGDIRHNLQIIDILRDNDGIIKKFKCKCLKCEVIKTIRRSKFGTTKSCGCMKGKKGKLSFRFKGYEGLSGSKWGTYARNAHFRNITFQVSIEDAWNKLVKQEFKCKISNVPIFLKGRGGTASLDRINNKIGYTIDNIHWVHKKINQIKMDMSTKEFIDWCKLVAEYNKDMTECELKTI